MDQISPSDLQLFLSAQTALINAQNVMKFASDHITAIYDLDASCQINTVTGAIIRPTEVLESEIL